MNKALNISSNHQKRKQRGVALISVLLAVALCVIIAAKMLTQQSLQIQRSQNIFERQQAYWYAIGSEHFVKKLLEKIIKDDEGVINLEQDWATTGMTFPVPDGMIAGEISDLQSCFNLNSLYNPSIDDEQRKKHKDVFIRYLEKLDIISGQSVEDLADNVVDWLDPDDYAIGAVGYDGDMYTSMSFPYLSANSAFAHENELRLVYGFDPLVMAQLENKVCVIPDYSKFLINVNTINTEDTALLEAIFDIDADKAKDILSERPSDGFKDIQEFLNLDAVKKVKNFDKIDTSQFTVKSNFFKLVTNAYYNDIRFDLTSVMQLNDKQQIHVIARRFGGKVERKADPETEQSDN